MTDRLFLAAKDAEDLEILSACLQDAVGKLKDFVYLPKTRRFALLVNRFKWEDAAAGQRVRAGLYFDGVLAARARGVKRGASDAVVSLLTVRFTPKVNEEPAGEDPGGEIELVLAGGGAIALTVECIEAGLSDLSGPWDARGTPAHELPAHELGDG